jgi:hypothetical protein
VEEDSPADSLIQPHPSQFVNPISLAKCISMSSRPVAQAVSAQHHLVLTPNPDYSTRLEIQALNALAVRSLRCLFDENEKLFSRRVAFAEDGFHHETTSRRRTIIALLGLKRLADTGAPQPFDLTAIQDAVLADTGWVKSIGDLGLLAWMTAEFAPDRLGELIRDFSFATALERYPDGGQACTTSLAWFLAGIAHVQLANAGAGSELTDVAVDAYHLMQDNQGECGIFGHAGCSGYLTRAFYNRFGTFADQIYSIYALSVFARAYQIEEPLASALSCGNTMRALQGDNGEWWFLYDKRRCCVANRYPVLSLHQEGTAPVGLFALEGSTGQSFSERVYKGLSWVSGTNELGDDLRNRERGLIWDSMGPSKRRLNYWEAVCSVLHISRGPHRQRLSIFHEARPDHFGWLLYAFGKFGVS